MNEILGKAFKFWTDFGTGNNVVKRATHVVATVDDAAYEVGDPSFFQ